MSLPSGKRLPSGKLLQDLKTENCRRQSAVLERLKLALGILIPALEVLSLALEIMSRITCPSPLIEKRQKAKSKALKLSEVKMANITSPISKMVNSR